MGKSTKKWPFSIAMLVYQRVYPNKKHVDLFDLFASRYSCSPSPEQVRYRACKKSADHKPQTIGFSSIGWISGMDRRWFLSDRTPYRTYYPLVMADIVIENCHLYWICPLNMAIFHITMLEFTPMLNCIWCSICLNLDNLDPETR